MTLYSTLYNRALAQITDPLLAQLPEEDLEMMLHDWLMDAIVEPVVGEYDFSDRDEELKQVNFDIFARSSGSITPSVLPALSSAYCTQ